MTTDIVPQTGGLLAPNKETEIIVARALNGAEREPIPHGGALLLPTMPTKAERALLQARHKAIASHLLDFDKRIVARAVADVIGCYRNFIKPNENPEHVIAKYVKELQGIPTWACVRACNAIRNLQAPSFSIVHPFSTLQLRDLAESYVARLRDEAETISRILRAKPLPPPISEEQRERIKRSFGRLAYQLRRKTDQQWRSESAPAMQWLNARHTARILQEYRANSQEPKYAGDTLLSPALLRTLR